jgi:hypothetical protein
MVRLNFDYGKGLTHFRLTRVEFTRPTRIKLPGMKLPGLLGLAIPELRLGLCGIMLHRVRLCYPGCCNSGKGSV